MRHPSTRQLEFVVRQARRDGIPMTISGVGALMSVFKEQVGDEN